jgi:hypothetical protein
MAVPDRSLREPRYTDTIAARRGGGLPRAGCAIGISGAAA